MSYRTAEPIELAEPYRTCRGRHYRTLVTLALGERWELTGGLVFLFPSDFGFVGYYLFRCFYMLLCEIPPLQGCFVLYPYCFIALMDYALKFNPFEVFLDGRGIGKDCLITKL